MRCFGLMGYVTDTQFLGPLNSNLETSLYDLSDLPDPITDNALDSIDFELGQHTGMHDYIA